MTTLQALPEPDIIPSAASSEKDFDFLEGKWLVHNRKLKTRLKQCHEWIEFDAHMEMRKILQGLGNTDTFCVDDGNKMFEAVAIRLFNPRTRLWSIYWADSNYGVLDKPVIGSFEHDTGKFYNRDKYNGIPIITQFNWDISDPSKPVWSQAFSADEGESWEWNWYMHLERL